MVFKNFKTRFALPILTLFIIPNFILAYSNYVIPGGENIGIEIHAKEVMIVGMYKVGNNYPGYNAGLKVGDKITTINGNKITSINEMVNEITNHANDLSINMTYVRDGNSKDTVLELIKDDNNIYKTGLYVKDSINGIGTLTYIDPNTNIYGALGHEIIEKTTGQKIEVKDGKIFKSDVTGINKSVRGKPGEKNADYDTNITYGSISKNTTSGIFGKYINDVPNKDAMEVAQPDEIKTGEAEILTVLNGTNIEHFKINILKLNSKDEQNKNILFEITDEYLLSLTGGVIQGMSGSPIIQNNKIIGAVTHVIVDDTKRGYGIFITNMLEQGEKKE